MAQKVTLKRHWFRWQRRADGRVGGGKKSSICDCITQWRVAMRYVHSLLADSFRGILICHMFAYSLSLLCYWCVKVYLLVCTFEFSYHNGTLMAYSLLWKYTYAYLPLSLSLSYREVLWCRLISLRISENAREKRQQKRSQRKACLIPRITF